jgi:N-6 DNA Methylase
MRNHSIQQSIWPYDFGVIPIETVSAIYERFLKPSDKKQGAFYTPPFLVELVLDIALSNVPSLLGLQFLDPACGSGIFLVGLFNRIAEEWRQKNPRARNDHRARELMKIIRSNIFGIDANPTACRITAFSLYLAYLDQLAPRDIQELQAKGNALPRLVNHIGTQQNQGSIWCGDFFYQDAPYPANIDIVVGNPPWGKTAEENSLPASWCEKMELTLPSRQIATAFMWKTTRHVRSGGRICLILPNTILFEQVSTSIEFQKQFFAQNTLDLVLNLTDYQRFLFKHAEYPAIVLHYRNEVPEIHHQLAYWFPKFDWKVKNADIISISDYDRHTVTLESVLSDLDANNVPKVWKQVGWATPRDIRLINRLSQISPLEDYVRKTSEETEHKPWLVAAGIEPVDDDVKSYATIELPTDLYLKTDSSVMRLFILPEDCVKLPTTSIKVRKRSNKTTDIFQPPHVLITYGFTGIAYADFAVAFHHAVRGITGPLHHRSILMFLASYLRSSLARYYMFHTSSNWGIGMQVVSLRELLKLPFLWPTTERQLEIIDKVAKLVEAALSGASDDWIDRTSLVDQTQAKIEVLILEYFDIWPNEHILIEDTLNVSAPSFRPTTNSQAVPSIKPSSSEMIHQYAKRLCSTLNDWSKRSNVKVIYRAKRSLEMGIALVILEVTESEGSAPVEDDWSIMTALHGLQKAATIQLNAFELLRGVKAFEGNRLYIMKPIGQRYWTETSALNDADEIATAILMSPQEVQL